MMKYQSDYKTNVTNEKFRSLRILDMSGVSNVTVCTLGEGDNVTYN